VARRGTEGPAQPVEVETEVRAQEQAELDARWDAVGQAIAEVSVFRFGFVPRDSRVTRLVTYQFVHGGILHLLGNLWFLWLVGCNVEDGWGRRVFLAFYLSAGVVAALAHKLGAWNSPIPLVGASGAIAGAMGAFLLRHARTRIRMLIVILWRWRVVQAPAYLMLPLWVALEVVMGLLDAGSRGGVAHWAHVGGFAYGVAFALGLRLTGVEKKLDQAVDASWGTRQDPRIVAAGELISAGRAEDALRTLKELVREQPRSIDVRMELLRAADSLGDRALAQATKAELVELYLRQDMTSTALSLYVELVGEGAREAAPPAARLRIARLYERVGELGRARSEFAALHGDPDARSVLLASLVGHAEIAFRLRDFEAALGLFQEAERNLGLNRELESVVRQGLARARAAMDRASDLP
jgi:membrane associated rhomboid family serine protease